MTTSSQLTYGGVLLAVFANQVGLPVPSVAFLMVAGALSAHGGMRKSIIVFLGVLGCLAGDGIWFLLGSKWGSLLRKSRSITVPDSVKIILYSSSGSDTVSARTAVGLKRRGVDKVWVLEGGLKAWRDHGYPCLSIPGSTRSRRKTDGSEVGSTRGWLELKTDRSVHKRMSDDNKRPF